MVIERHVCKVRVDLMCVGGAWRHCRLSEAMALGRVDRGDGLRRAGRCSYGRRCVRQLRLGEGLEGVCDA